MKIFAIEMELKPNTHFREDFENNMAKTRLLATKFSTI